MLLQVTPNTTSLLHVNEMSPDVVSRSVMSLKPYNLPYYNVTSLMMEMTNFWFSSFLQQCSTAKGNWHMSNNNKMAAQHVFAGSSTSGTRSVTVLSVGT